MQTILQIDICFAELLAVLQGRKGATELRVSIIQLMRYLCPD
jgi:hypothetical protein